MQERNSEKVVSLTVKATKMTANVLKSAVKAYLSAQKNKSQKVYKGKQSVKHLIQKGEKLTNIEVTDQNDKTSSSFGQRGATIINESDFYSLVLASRMPNAKKFKR